MAIERINHNCLGKKLTNSEETAKAIAEVHPIFHSSLHSPSFLCKPFYVFFLFYILHNSSSTSFERRAEAAFNLRTFSGPLKIAE